MRAVRFHDTRDIRVDDVPEPDADLGPSAVLLRPRLCGICGSDLREYVAGPIDISREPHPVTGAQMPQILGHEFSADVEAVGRAVSAVRPGDRVVVMPAMFCGECAYCRRDLQHLCTRIAWTGMNAPWGGMAELAVVEEYQVTRLPDGVSYEQGALIEPAAVVVNAVHRAGVRAGDAVLVTGAGPIGALSVLAARAAGAGQVFLSEPNDDRAARAVSVEPDAVLNPVSSDICTELRERTGGLGVDVAIECSGNGTALQTCLQAVCARGTVVQVGLHVGDVPIDAAALTERELTLVGVHVYPVSDLARIAAQIDSGTLPVERVVTSTIALEDAVYSGFDALVDPAATDIKILVATG
jgi:(R,R)-butanediol dehydrogenase/meso-butanediol dehydrogenase/diacetyl reductase